MSWHTRPLSLVCDYGDPRIAEWYFDHFDTLAVSMCADSGFEVESLRFRVWGEGCIGFDLDLVEGLGLRV